MTGSKANNGLLAGLFPRLEHRGQPLAPHWLFYRRLSINFALGLAFILVSLAAGMLGYRYLEGLSLATVVRPRRHDSWRHGALF